MFLGRKKTHNFDLRATVTYPGAKKRENKSSRCYQVNPRENGRQAQNRN